MADKTTKPEDVIIPDLFTQYVLEETTEKSEIVASGAVENNSTLNEMLSSGGATTFTMPKWEDLGGESEVFTAQKGSETEKVGSHAEIGVKIMREKSWGFHDLAHSFAADDPARDFAEKVGKWWRRDEKRNLMSILRGVIASSDMADHVLDITSAASTVIEGKQVLDAKQLMGDAADDLSLIYMHSAVFTALQKQQLIAYVQPADAKIAMPTYLGYNVICDDSAPVDVGYGGTKGVYTVTLGGTLTADDEVTVAGVTYKVTGDEADLAEVAANIKTALNAKPAVTRVYTVTAASNVITMTQVVAGTGAQPSASVSASATITATAATTTAGVAGVDVFTTFLLARGCIQRGIGTPPGFIGTEMERKANVATTNIFTRQAKILHPKGLSWNARPTDLTYETPTDSELATGAYWAQATTDLKNVGIVALKHTI